jgi:hypothetical protein
MKNNLERIVGKIGNAGGAETFVLPIAACLALGVLAYHGCVRRAIVEESQNAPVVYCVPVTQPVADSKAVEPVKAAAQPVVAEPVRPVVQHQITINHSSESRPVHVHERSASERKPREYSLKDFERDYKRAVSNLNHEKDECGRGLARLNRIQGRAVGRLIGSGMNLVVDGIKYSDYNTRHRSGRHNYSAINSAGNEIEHMVYDGHRFGSAAEAKEYLSGRIKEINIDLEAMQAGYEESLSEKTVLPDAKALVDSNAHSHNSRAR